MRKLGLIGGTGPESTVDYYQAIIAKYQEKTGNNEELPEFLINSINMYKIFELLEKGKTEDLTDYLALAVLALEKAGAEYAVLTANTAHIVFEEVQKEVGIPLISIVEETARTADKMKLEKIGLLGTKFTMENDFFPQIFAAAQKEIVVPNQQEQDFIHEKIVEELEKGIVEPETKDAFLKIVSRMAEQNGIQGVILGCTELPMLIKPEDSAIPQMNTTEIHVEAIVEAMLRE
ncbi:amino acid racemase [Planococcus shenhongbingii]|uniref:Amino acid racemase n=1 Tax=Planococcus shenhongbingii TaxID=3058398 RepID=A0ABT8NCL8_9BACL|nr:MULTISPECIES: amino acid racemase [unclassified Planococcus (in: firmicutes)]MDN7245300.1 amino acid racemase [Planococcus sp. N017]WKA58406.1 amino acid racemase [Planococcus sp. N016]